MRVIGIILCLIALGLTGYSALTYKAPEIQADIEAKTTKAISAIADGEVDVRVDGRHVMLSGAVADDEQRLSMLNAVAAVPGALGPVDALETAPPPAPYRFGAVKNEDGNVTIDGMAPSQEAKALIEAEAGALFGGDADVTIEIAEGPPSASWELAAIASLDALATLRHGTIAIVDSDIVLEGAVAADADIEAIEMFAETMPAGFTLAQDVSVHRERVEPFTFSVIKEPDNGLRLSGFAPDEDTRTALIEQGKATGGGLPVIADIRIADGMPDDAWPSLIIAGIEAMQDVAAGRYDVVGNDVSFTVGQEENAESEAQEAAPETEVARNTDETPADAASETAPPVPADGPVDAALTPEIDEPERRTPTLTVDKLDIGAWSMRGVLPDEEAKETLVALARKHAEVDEVDVDVISTVGADGDWLQFAAARMPALDTVRAGMLSFDDYDAHLIGVVETPEDIEPVKAAIAAIDRDMTVDLQPIDPRPIASLDLALSMDNGVVLNGYLPQGLAEDEAMLALGIRRHGGRVGEDGRGRVEAWRRDLSKIGAFLPAFEQVAIALGSGPPAIEGLLHAHHDAKAVADDLVLALGADQEPVVRVETTTATYDQGATRTNPLTGGDEIYRQGYWIPVIDISADANACDERTAALQASDRITFGRGQEDLDHRAFAVLNELAGLAIACSEQTDLLLKIGGHTDSRGAPEMNQALSQTRADAVRDALTARGVDGQALIAIGYGDSLPIADNATDEGRAANRRITFEWETPTEGQG